MKTVSQPIEKFVYERLIEENGGWVENNPEYGATGEAMLAYLDWLHAMPEDMRLDRYFREKAQRWKRHRAFKPAWLIRLKTG